MESLITVTEAATYLGVSEIHLRKLLEEGIIPYVNVAASNKKKKSIRIKRVELDDFVKKGGTNGNGSIR